jgi:hypothetical protein
LGELSIDSAPRFTDDRCEARWEAVALDAVDCDQTFVDNCQVESIDLNDAFHPTAL